MKIEIKFDCDNAAFGFLDTQQFGYEVATILRVAAEKFEQGWATFPLRDSNGNIVGRASLITGD
jgi:hypothetical protein